VGALRNAVRRESGITCLFVMSILLHIHMYVDKNLTKTATINLKWGEYFYMKE
jgi:hypothetical protein